jgi:hypothetical protein
MIHHGDKKQDSRGNINKDSVTDNICLFGVLGDKTCFVVYEQRLKHLAFKKRLSSFGMKKSFWISLLNASHLS